MNVKDKFNPKKKQDYTSRQTFIHELCQLLVDHVISLGSTILIRNRKFPVLNLSFG